MGKRVITDNFWTRKNAENGYIFKDIANLLGVCPSTAAYYFCGRILPDDDKIRKLCEFYDVDFAEGKEEFRKAFDSWGESHSDRYVNKGNYYERRNRHTSPAKNKPMATTLEDIPQNRTRGNPGKADNFWRSLRVNNNVSYDTLATVTDCTTLQLKNYFAGKHMPKSKTIKALCEFFHIDYKLGKKEFKNINSAYIATRSGLVSPTTEVKSDEVEVVPVQVSTPTAPVAPKTSESIIEMLYGKVSFEEFNQILAGQTSEDLLHSLYGKIDFDLFMQLVR